MLSLVFPWALVVVLSATLLSFLTVPLDGVPRRELAAEAANGLLLEGSSDCPSLPQASVRVRGLPRYRE